MPALRNFANYYVFLSFISLRHIIFALSTITMRSHIRIFLPIDKYANNSYPLKNLYVIMPGFAMCITHFRKPGFLVALSFVNI